MDDYSTFGQQGSDHGQYGQTPMASPFGMDGMANANQQQNDNTQNTNDYSPQLPNNTLTQGPSKQWYPGIYPNTQPQFGSNPYSPQTANIQGHPGHNPSTLPSVEPNMNNNAYSNQGQFVQRMATGGTGYQAGNFKFTDQAQKWAGPVNVNSSYSSQGTPNDVINAFGKGASAPGPAQSGSAKGPAQSGSAKGPGFTASGKGPATPMVAPKEANVYTPTYTTYAPTRTNVDSYGNQLWRSGGLMDIRK